MKQYLIGIGLRLHFQSWSRARTKQLRHREDKKQFENVHYFRYFCDSNDCLLCGDTTPPKLQPSRPPPFRPHQSVYSLAYINWISFDPIPARECLDTSRNRLKTIHSCLNSTPTNISLRFKLRICSTKSVRVSTMLMNHAFHSSQTNSCYIHTHKIDN